MQKLVAFIIGFPAFSGAAHLLFFREFRPSEGFFDIAVYLSAGLTVAYVSWVIKLRLEHKWKPPPKWDGFGRARKLYILTFAPFLVYLIFWLNVGYALPYYLTSAFGSEMQVTVPVVKERTYSRYACDYQITSVALRRIFFQACISEREFSQLPDVEFEAILNVKQSSLGLIFEGMSRNRSDREGVTSGSKLAAFIPIAADGRASSRERCGRHTVRNAKKGQVMECKCDLRQVLF